MLTTLSWINYIFQDFIFTSKYLKFWINLIFDNFLDLK